MFFSSHLCVGLLLLGLYSLPSPPSPPELLLSLSNSPKLSHTTHRTHPTQLLSSQKSHNSSHNSSLTTHLTQLNSLKSCFRVPFGGAAFVFSHWSSPKFFHRTHLTTHTTHLTHERAVRVSALQQERWWGCCACAGIGTWTLVTHPTPPVTDHERAVPVSSQQQERWWGCCACVCIGTWTLSSHPTPPHPPHPPQPNPKWLVPSLNVRGWPLFVRGWRGFSVRRWLVCNVRRWLAFNVRRWRVDPLIGAVTKNIKSACLQKNRTRYGNRALFVDECPKGKPYGFSGSIFYFLQGISIKYMDYHHPFWESGKSNQPKLITTPLVFFWLCSSLTVWWTLMATSFDFLIENKWIRIG